MRCFLYRYLASLAAPLLLLMPSLAFSQDLEPRSYTNVPVGMTFLALGAGRSEGDLSPVPSSPLQDAELTIDAAVLGLAHTFALAGKSAKFDMAAGRTCYEGSAIFQGEFVEGRRCEYLDPKLRLTWNFFGAPAMDLEKFRTWSPELVIGASLQVGAPLGTYNSENLLNAGANRWMIRPGLGMTWRRGNWSYELMGSVRFFEDNDDFFNGIYVEQDPLYSIQGHLIYRLPRGAWLSVNANWYRGGETTQDGVSKDDYVENSRWGATYTIPFNAHHSFKLYGSTGVVTRIGGDFDTYGVAWLYTF